ncbi:MAG: DUF58 domain-containing protein [Candidatus Sumerlaeaceae bacterium]
MSARKTAMSQYDKHYLSVPAADSGSSARGVLARMLHDLFTLQRYRITIEGMSLIFVSCLIGFAAWHSGTNLLYLVFATLIALFLTHGLLVWLCLLGIRMQRILPTHVYAGRPCSITVRLYNRKHYIDSHGLRVSDSGTNSKSIGVVFFGTIPKHGWSEEVYETVFPVRGIHLLRNLEAITRYPFGLVERGLKINITQEMLVYPQVNEVGALGTNLVAGFGDQEVSEKGFGTELYGLREYIPGEHARHIHWRSSARLQRLMVIEHERDERRHVSLQLWNVAAGEIPDELLQDFEEAVNLTASLANFLIREGFEVKLVTASGSTADGQGRNHLYTILRVLASLELLSHGREQAPRVDSGALVKVRFHNNEWQQYARSQTITVDSRQFSVSNGRYIRTTGE